MYLIIKQKLNNGIITDEVVMWVSSEEKAHEIVQSIRKQQNNQLCYYKKA